MYVISSAVIEILSFTQKKPYYFVRCLFLYYNISIFRLRPIITLLLTASTSIRPTTPHRKFKCRKIRSSPPRRAPHPTWCRPSWWAARVRWARRSAAPRTTRSPWSGRTGRVTRSWTVTWPTDTCRTTRLWPARHNTELCPLVSPQVSRILHKAFPKTFFSSPYTKLFVIDEF